MPRRADYLVVHAVLENRSLRQIPCFGPDQGIFLRPRRAVNLPDQKNNRILNALRKPRESCQANAAETKQGIDVQRTGTRDQAGTSEQGNRCNSMLSSLQGGSGRQNPTDALSKLNQTLADEAISC